MQISIMQKKIEKIFFDFEIIAFELVVLDTRFYWERILVPAVNMLTNSLKISDTTKIEFFQLISFHSDQKIWKKYCRADLSNLSDMLTFHECFEMLLFRHLSNPLFAVYNFRKKWPLRLIFFSKVFTIICILRKCSKKLRKYILILR